MNSQITFSPQVTEFVSIYFVGITDLSFANIHSAQTTCHFSPLVSAWHCSSRYHSMANLYFPFPSLTPIFVCPIHLILLILSVTGFRPVGLQCIPMKFKYVSFMILSGLFTPKIDLRMNY